MAELDKIVDQLSKLTVMEAAELAKKLEEVWGVSASLAPVALATNQTSSDTSASNADEKSDYDVMLESIGDKKINVIKEVKAITGLGLKESKDLVESAPKIVKSAVPHEEAKKMKEKLEAAGATVSLK